MIDFWLPIDQMVPSELRKVKAGRLILLPPRGSSPHSPSVGIKLAAPDSIAAFALTSFYGRYPPGDVVRYPEDNSSTVLFLNAALSIEVNAGSEVVRRPDDFRPGDLLFADEGMSIAAFFGRHSSSSYQTVGTIDTKTWAVRSAEMSRILFGSWRLRIDVEGQRPLFWQPRFPSDAEV